MDEQKLAKQIEEIKKVASQDKKIDAASLMISVLQKQHENLLPFAQKRWGYLISLLLPPFGLIFAVKFYYSGKDDGEQAAWICGLITAVSILFAAVIFKMLSSATAINP